MTTATKDASTTKLSDSDLASGAPNRAPARPAATGSKPVTLVGLDLGTNASCVLAGPTNSTDISLSKIIPTVVGYPKEGIVDGIITGNAGIVFGEAAIQHMLHLNLIAPLEQGIISHREAARDFLGELRSLIDPHHKSELRVVIGVPANASEEAREDIRQTVTGLFDRVLLIPEPFLAALGFRDDSRIGQAGYTDPVTNSLFVDIGGGTTDLCLVQGYFPTADDQISLPFAGDAVDQLLASEIARTYPHTGISQHKVRSIKEAHAYAGESRGAINVPVIVGGKTRDLELGAALGKAGNALVDQVFEAMKKLIGRASSDSVEILLQNIIVTGGGSQLKGIDTVLQARLEAEGYASPKVRLAGRDFKRYVALGALKAARAARENQWQYLLA